MVARHGQATSQISIYIYIEVGGPPATAYSCDGTVSLYRHLIDTRSDRDCGRRSYTVVQKVSLHITLHNFVNCPLSIFSTITFCRLNRYAINLENRPVFWRSYAVCVENWPLLGQVYNGWVLSADWKYTGCTEKVVAPAALVPPAALITQQGN